ncbi:ATP-dependent RNA helicase [Nocardia mangyaensis]|uniref:ATP-dependent RNA helicase n=1 Tax=Nocardia mangyaensis TaxID=2213200 RepID=UPI001F0AE8A7|nr:ATP-dependent helicase C-terminal domain-containing protein [Nocardia mangyaensis]
MKLPELPDLPVRSALGEIVATLAARGVAVLVAPPGTGKTTLVPLALAAGTAGRVVVAEPRRLAARAAAARMASLLGERVGETVGYSVRGDRKVGPRTRIEVVTSGLLVRRLQQDPELSGVDTVMLDECHERHLDADLLLALLLDARAGLRPDLRVLATSATVAADRLAELLGAGMAGPSAQSPAGEAWGAEVVVSSADAGPFSARPESGDVAARLDGRSTAPLASAPPVGGARPDPDGSSATVSRPGRAPVLEVRGRTYPVEIGYLPALRRERIEAQVARATRHALSAGVGDVLVFLPGVGEINRTAGLLRDLDDVDVVVLHGRLGGGMQDLALRPGARRRVVLSTAIAESSLTVPGVRAVVDSGLSRVPRVDHRRGLSGLATVRVSAAVAEQRAGRAGREAPGQAWRCWPEYEHHTLPAYPEPEIRTAELTRLALELACWGTPDGSALAWWDAPPEGPLTLARTTLRTLGALDPTGHITPRGRAMAALGLHPRLARALLDGATRVGPKAAAEMVVLMDDDSLTTATDAAAALRALRAERPPRWTKEVQRLTRLVTEHLPSADPTPTSHPTLGPKTPERDSSNAPRDGTNRGRGATEDAAAARGAVPGASGASTGVGASRGGAAGGPGAVVARSAVSGAAGSAATAGAAVSGAAGAAGETAALLIALAQPERLARRRSAGSSTYLMAGGTAVTLPPGAGLAEAEWLAVAVADRDPGRAEGRIRLAAIADEELAREAAPGLVTQVEEVRWDSGDVVARRVERFGAITLSDKPLREPDRALLAEAVRQGLRTDGLDLLRWDADARTLRQRLDFLHRALGAPWPAVDDDALLADLDAWLGPELSTARRRRDLTRIDAGTALRRLLPWPEATRLDELAPERLEVPSGSRIRLDYSADQPILAVKVQEILGWTAPPALADGRAHLVLHLLSPAQRPVAVTADLPSFWRTGWSQVRADLRGRYPKHAWPEDPTTVIPHRGTARRAQLDK